MEPIKFRCGFCEEAKEGKEMHNIGYNTISLSCFECNPSEEMIQAQQEAYADFLYDCARDEGWL